MESILKFKTYEIEETIFRKNLNTTNNNNDISPSVECSIMRKKDSESEVVVRLTVEIGEDNQEESPIYVLA